MTSVMWFRRDLRLARQPGAARGGCGRRRRCRCSCSTRRSGARPGRPAAPTSPRRSAPSTASSGSGGRRLSVVRGDPVRRVVLAAKAGRRRAGARGRRLRPLRSPPRPGRRAGARGRRRRAGPHRLAVRRRARPGHQRLGRPLQGLHAVLAGPGPSTAGAARSTRPTGASWLELGRGHHRHPGPGAARRARAARGRRGRGAAPLARRSSTGSTTTTTTGTSPASTAPRGCRCTSSGARSTRARCSPTWRRTRSAGAATYRKELAWREFYADVLFHQPRTAREYLRPEFARMPYDEPGAQLDAWQAGPHRLPDRRRRHAPAARDRLDAQPGADDRRPASWSRTCTSSGSTAPGTSCAGWSTATSPPTSTAGSGWRAAAPTRRRTSGSSTRPPRAGSSTPTAATSGAGSRSCADPDRVPDPHDPDADTRGLVGYPAPIVDHRPERREALARWEAIRLTRAARVSVAA